MNAQELEDRLIDFAVLILKHVEHVNSIEKFRFLRAQLARSGTAPALNYAEARGAESKRDFIHKCKIVLKELRETLVCLKIMEKSNVLIPEKLMDEANQLVAIFVSTCKTSSNN